MNKDKRIRELEEALEAYADEENWSMDDDYIHLVVWYGSGYDGYDLARKTLGHSSSSD